MVDRTIKMRFEAEDTGAVRALDRLTKKAQGLQGEIQGLKNRNERLAASQNVVTDRMARTETRFARLARVGRGLGAIVGGTILAGAFALLSGKAQQLGRALAGSLRSAEEAGRGMVGTGRQLDLLSNRYKELKDAIVKEATPAILAFIAALNDAESPLARFLGKLGEIALVFGDLTGLTSPIERSARPLIDLSTTREEIEQTIAALEQGRAQIAGDVFGGTRGGKFGVFAGVADRFRQGLQTQGFDLAIAEAKAKLDALLNPAEETASTRLKRIREEAARVKRVLGEAASQFERLTNLRIPGPGREFREIFADPLGQAGAVQFRNVPDLADRFGTGPTLPAIEVTELDEALIAMGSSAERAAEAQARYMAKLDRFASSVDQVFSRVLDLASSRLETFGDFLVGLARILLQELNQLASSSGGGLGQFLVGLVTSGATSVASPGSQTASITVLSQPTLSVTATDARDFNERLVEHAGTLNQLTVQGIRESLSIAQGIG